MLPCRSCHSTPGTGECEGPCPAGVLLFRAENVAIGAHMGQLDKAGRDYFHAHVADVERRVREAGYGTAARIVAFLHDVLEDTPVTETELREDFPDFIVDAVVAISRRDGEAPDDYYARVRGDPLARVVKVYGDIPSNTDPARAALLDPVTRKRLEKKYAHAIDVLTGKEEA